MKTIDLSRPLLGPPDANDDDNLKNYYVAFGDFEELKRKHRFAVVGPTGRS
jgi:hypothetical protein